MPTGRSRGPGLAAVAAGLLLYRWRGRPWRNPLGRIWLGLAISAALAMAAAAAQLFPVIEFTQQTTRASIRRHARAVRLQHRAVSLDRTDLAQHLGSSVRRQHLLGADDPTAGRLPQDLGALALPGWVHLPPGHHRSWFSQRPALAGVALGNHGREHPGCAGRVHQPHLAYPGVRRRVAHRLQSSLSRPIWARSTSSIPGSSARTAYLRDGDGGIYWLLATLLPGFRQFRFPAKLFTFTVWRWRLRRDGLGSPGCPNALALWWS